MPFAEAETAPTSMIHRADEESITAHEILCLLAP
jgi:hypothetical protein